MAVHQLIPSFVPGDATGLAAVHLQAQLRRLGQTGEIFAGELHRSLRGRAYPVESLRPGSSDVVLYHHGIASPLSGTLLHLSCRKGLVFHNISPTSYYRSTRLESALEAGRAQLAALAPHVDVAIGVSTFNAAELTLAGFSNVHVVPLYVEPWRFAATQADLPFQANLQSSRGPVMLSVSRALPHKRFEDLIALHRENLRRFPEARLLLAGSASGSSAYVRKLQREAAELPGIFFLGKLSHEKLVAAYRAATLYVSMSEHEGFGVPLLEAFAADLPVLAFAAAAVPETLGGAGVAFTEKRFAFLGELVKEVHENPPLREQLIAGGRRRLAELSAEASLPKLRDALSFALPKSAPVRRAIGRKRRHVALVVQRFGKNVTGGAEKMARDIALRLAEHVEVTVLTTTALDHLTWENYFPEGVSKDGPLTLRRFPVARTRNLTRFNRFSAELYGHPQDRVTEERWLDEQGPVAPALLRYLSEHAHRYDGFIFFTYLYAPTVYGLPLVSSRAICVPTVHDEPPIYFGIYREVLASPRVHFCSTFEEQAFIRRSFPDAARTRIVGTGIDANRAVPERLRQKYGLKNEFLFYLGRVEPGKGVDELLRFYRALRRQDRNAPDLVVAGHASMEVKGEGVHFLGRITEEEKWDALAAANIVVVPSRYESLSLLALEGFAQGTPLLANGHSDVLQGHVDRSKAGASYKNVDEFVAGVAEIRARRAELAQNALRYVKGYLWSNVVQAYLDELSAMGRSTAAAGGRPRAARRSSAPAKIREKRT